jgi:hypothetical protein
MSPGNVVSPIMQLNVEYISGPTSLTLWELVNDLKTFSDFLG